MVQRQFLRPSCHALPAWLRAFTTLCCLLACSGGAGEPDRNGSLPHRSASGKGTVQPPIRVALVSTTNSAATLSGNGLRIRRGSLQWSVESNLEGRRFGRSVAMADIDGDAIPELFIGQPRGISYRTPGNVLLLSRAVWEGLRPPELLDWGRGLRSLFGFSLANAGDLNGDGLSDVSVGAPQYSNGQLYEGAFFVLYGSRKGGPFMPGFQRESDHPKVELGLSMAPVGDMNGDGYGDLLVGAPRHPVHSFQEGAAYLYLGSSTGLVGSVWAYNSHQREAHGGQALAGAGDVNRDGYSDALIGMPGFDSNHSDAGRVALFLGSKAGFKQKPDWIADGPHAHARFGAALTPAGDLNGDGFADVLIGAPGVGDEVKVAGWVFAYLGTNNGLMNVPAWAVSDQQDGAEFGAALASLGDLNGDRHADFLIGASGFDGRYANQGRVSLFLGTAMGLPATPDWTLEGGQPGAECGACFAAGGDFNGDGLNDFVVAAPAYSTIRSREGRVDVFLGSRTAYQRANEFPVDGTNSVTLPRERFNPSSTPSVHRAASLSSSAVYAAAAGFILALGLGLLLWRRRNLASVQRERRRLARDLHDDLGARLTRISVLTELVRREAASSEEGRRNAQLLAETAREVLESMEQVIWSVNPANDTLENLVIFIIQYAGPFLAPSGIELDTESPEHLPDRPLPAELRKSVFLSVKEALNNVVKHSGATRVALGIRFDASTLTIVIEDNGRGFETADGGDSRVASIGSDGLMNMRDRMREAGGTFAVEEVPGGGARVTLRVQV